MSRGISHYLAIVLTAFMVGGIAYWAWTGLKSPPVSEPSVKIVVTPTGWQRIDTGKFSLYAPEGTQFRRSPPGVDTSGGEIIGPTFHMRYMIGMWVDNLKERRTYLDYTERHTIVDGRQAIQSKALLRTFEQELQFGVQGHPYFVSMYIPKAFRFGENENSWEALNVQGTAPSEEDRDTLEEVFKTIRFDEGVRKDCK
jgi:hypothetical protein